jgi:hypothetical protein
VNDQAYTRTGVNTRLRCLEAGGGQRSPGLRSMGATKASSCSVRATSLRMQPCCEMRARSKPTTCVGEEGKGGHTPG